MICLPSEQSSCHHPSSWVEPVHRSCTAGDCFAKAGSCCMRMELHRDSGCQIAGRQTTSLVSTRAG